MALVIDLYSTKGVHERVNGALFRFLKICARKNKKNVNVVGDISLENLTEFNFKGINIERKNKLSTYIFRDIILPFYVLVMILDRVIRKETTMIVGFSRVHCITLIPFIIFLSHFGKFSILIHSQLEVIENSKSSKGIKWLYHVIAKYFLLKLLKNKKVNKLVLSDHIVDSLKLEGIEFASLKSVEHPFTTNDYKDLKAIKFDLELGTKIGTFGLLRNDTKNTSAIYELARRNSGKDFKLVGRKGPLFEWENEDNVENIKLNKMLSQDEIFEICKDISHFVYLFPLDKYKYTSSGSALDAVIFKKKVIISKNESLRSALKGFELKFEVDDELDLDGIDSQKDTSISSNLTFVRKRAWLPFNSGVYSDLTDWARLDTYEAKSVD